MRWAMAVAVALLLAAPPVAAADGVPAVVDVRPLPGEVVGAGLVPVSARVGGASGAPVLVRVDGRDAGAAAPSDERAVVRAAPVLGPGDHVAQVVVGRQVLRAWRFTVSEVEVLRLAGSGAVATAVEISRDRYRIDGTASAAVLTGVADDTGALAATPLAAAADAPLLLTGAEALAPPVAAELRRALDPGATVHLVGGLDVLGEQVERAVAELGFVPERLAGADAAETAALVARRVRLPSLAAFERRGGDRVVVVAEDRVGEALPVAAAAAAQRWPILVTGGQELAPATRAYLAEASPAEVLAVGVPAPAGAELRALAGAVPRPREAPERSSQARAVGLTDAGEPLVALAGAVHAAGSGMPLLVVDGDLPEPLRAAVSQDPPRLIVGYGNTSTLAPEVVGALRRAVTDRGGPPLAAVEAAPGAVVVRFARDVLLAHSSLTLSVEGGEVPGVLTEPEPGVLALTLTDPPEGRLTARLVGAVTDGTAWTHLDETLTLPAQTP